MRPKMTVAFIIIALLAAAGYLAWKNKKMNASREQLQEIYPTQGSIRLIISSTGSVLPKNRLEIKPPIAGRVEKILVEEGQKVKTGEVLAWMSSIERAALLDAARGKTDEDLKYWEEAYKPVPLSSPIDAEVIVAKTQPGQTITTVDPVLVLSDRLIVRAQVDETDIGKVKKDMKAYITLDAYSDNRINARVEHIYHESKTVNNVTIYEVDLEPEEIPVFFRSGMNANIDFVLQEKENILIIPMEALQKQNGESYVLLKQKNSPALRAKVSLGISDDKNIEVVSGISKSDTLLINGKKYSPPQKSSTGTNPFIPNRRKR